MAKRRELPSQEVLRWTYDYDPATGALIDRLSGKRVHVSYHAGTGRVRIGMDRPQVSINRMIWKWHFGDEPEIVYPADGRADNHRIENLRATSRSEHSRLRMAGVPKSQIKARDTPKNTTVFAKSGVRGVFWSEAHKAWTVKGDMVNGKSPYIGLYRELSVAVAARRAWERGEQPPATEKGGTAPGSGAAGHVGVGKTPAGTWCAKTDDGQTIGTYNTVAAAIEARVAWEAGRAPPEGNKRGDHLRGSGMSGLDGVTWNSGQGVWVVRNAARRYVGKYKNLEVAKAARRAALAGEPPPPTVKGAKGESNASAKLTADIVRQIRNRKAAGERTVTLAAEFGISLTNAKDIIRRRIWKDV